MHSEIYKAHVQNPKDLNTKAIDKINNRMNKENSSLTFNAQSLKKAEVSNLYRATSSSFPYYKNFIAFNKIILFRYWDK